MLLNALPALEAIAGGFATAASSDAGRFTEMWRIRAHIVFAGLWAVIAVQPRRQWGIWELLFVQKAAITIFALLNPGLVGAALSTAVDGWLVLSTALAFVLSRAGWPGRG
jgi:hypothetical protein